MGLVTRAYRHIIYLGTWSQGLGRGETREEDSHSVGVVSSSHSGPPAHTCWGMGRFDRPPALIPHSQGSPHSPDVPGVLLFPLGLASGLHGFSTEQPQRSPGEGGDQGCAGPQGQALPAAPEGSWWHSNGQSRRQLRGHEVTLERCPEQHPKERPSEHLYKGAWSSERG